ncbi:histidine kinase [Arcobacter sp. CECT 8989]|uniref:sensor histidine kinase n=1 Tax=Arcobacter sp. CECT 8989 TaxID=2044509 RepID=UPI00100AA82A|nr:HAMP domain-containing sensor histidine kinase [Arcobacter sp. CECT 8989]RXK03065.1 histidine kinase [Arcobacter sp. CECT 8989]
MKQTSLADFMELEEQNKELEKLVAIEVEKNRQKDEIIFQQNKLAAMGEMLENIAHQWRQPLMELSALFIPIEAKINFNKNINNDELLDSINKLNHITKYMSNTIDDFKNFFATNKEKTEFKLSDQINSSLGLIITGLRKNGIFVDIVIKKNPTIFGYKNEYTQVLINILNNAKDALIYRKVKEPKIIITLDSNNKNSILSVEDNAGGVQVKPIDNIFKPFFTYGKKEGTGIGLFMSKLIIEKNMNGKLLVSNEKAGASFRIISPLK